MTASAKNKQKKRRLGTSECRCPSLSGQEDWWPRKETAGTYSITGREPTLTTSEDNYNRSLFSFRCSCINQIMTRSIGIHLKWKIRVIKKTTKQKQTEAQRRRTAQRHHRDVSRRTVSRRLLCVHSVSETCKSSGSWAAMSEGGDIVQKDRDLGDLLLH